MNLSQKLGGVLLAGVVFALTPQISSAGEYSLNMFLGYMQRNVDFTTFTCANGEETYPSRYYRDEIVSHVDGEHIVYVAQYLEKNEGCQNNRDTLHILVKELNKEGLVEETRRFTIREGEGIIGDINDKKSKYVEGFIYSVMQQQHSYSLD